ncbi:MAG: cytidine deaminase [Planctomycetaceae bacterium]|nr:cytidine deaminase [Planctomycetaceae bacterium]|tara:strand:+ start:198 stop:581 length:384 start_codon:yes stop_codon:yes gene_type:complete
MSPAELIHLATEVRKKAFAPFSHFTVGAAVANAQGDYAVGCNVENAAFGSTICAEAGALSQAVAQGIEEITNIAIVTETGAAPCGNCRQLIAQLAPNCHVHLASTAALQIRTLSIRELLPDAFTSLE